METLLPALVQVALFVLLLAVITRYLGAFMVQVFEGQRNLLSPGLLPVENGIYRVFRINPQREQTWVAYTAAMIGFSIGTLLGGLAQLGVQLPALWKTGYRFRFVRDWNDSGVKRAV